MAWCSGASGYKRAMSGAWCSVPEASIQVNFQASLGLPAGCHNRADQHAWVRLSKRYTVRRRIQGGLHRQRVDALHASVRIGIGPSISALRHWPANCGFLSMTGDEAVSQARLGVPWEKHSTGANAWQFERGYSALPTARIVVHCASHRAGRNLCAEPAL